MVESSSFAWSPFRPCSSVYQQLWCVMQDPRLLSYALRLRYSDFDKVDKIISDINAFLTSHPGVDQKLPHKAGLTDLATYSVDLSIMVSTLDLCNRLNCVYMPSIGSLVMLHWHPHHAVPTANIDSCHQFVVLWFHATLA